MTFKLTRQPYQTQIPSLMIKFLLDPDIEEWKKSAHKEITQLESKDTWLKVPTSEATSKILPGIWVFCCNLLQKSSQSSRQDIVSEVTYKKTYQKLVHMKQSGLYLSSPLPKNGILSVWTSTMPLSKLTLTIQSRYIFPEDTNPSQPQLHVSDSRKASIVYQLHPSFGINIYEKD